MAKHESYTPGVWDKHTEDPVTRFDRCYEQAEGCWLWTGKVIKFRTGPRPKFTHGSRIDGSRTDEYAARYAWQRWMGSIPAYLAVCHDCDNTMCVRPGHLWLGTRYENNKDRCFKGRCAHGIGPHGRAPVKYALGKDP